MGTTVPLKNARVPFAMFFVQMHNRIHPIVADRTLASLSGLPASDPLSAPTLKVMVEMNVRPDGSIARMGVVRTSGVGVFDLLALDAVNEAAPFGAAPSRIVSPDGLVHLHWEFHRNVDIACTPANARPYLLKSPTTEP